MNQTTIKRFQLYLSEVICYYHRYGTLRGFSVLASKHNTSKIPSEMFFQAGLDQMPMGSVPSMETCLEILQNINRRRQNSSQKLLDRIEELENLLDVATSRNANLVKEVDRLKKAGTKLKAPALFHVVLPDGLPFKHAFMSSSPVDDASEYMVSKYIRKTDLADSLAAAIRQATNNRYGLKHTGEYYELDIPCLCSDGWIGETYTVGLIIDTNNGNSWWLTRDLNTFMHLSAIAGL
jgi:hypothetical protein